MLVAGLKTAVYLLAEIWSRIIPAEGSGSVVFALVFSFSLTVISLNGRLLPVETVTGSETPP